jgi:hypothetical protein
LEAGEICIRYIPDFSGENTATTMVIYGDDDLEQELGVLMRVSVRFHDAHIPAYAEGALDWFLTNIAVYLPASFSDTDCERIRDALVALRREREICRS